MQNFCSAKIKNILFFLLKLFLFLKKNISNVEIYEKQKFWGLDIATNGRDLHLTGYWDWQIIGNNRGAVDST